MVDLQSWLELYASDNRVVKIRAARALLRRSAEAPLAILLDILDTLAREGLGADTHRALLERRDAALFGEMIVRLASPDEFLRETACEVLGRLGNVDAMPNLVTMLDDPHVMVRRASALALGNLDDVAAIPVLRRALERRKNDDINVVWALERALDRLEAVSESGDADRNYLL